MKIGEKLKNLRLTQELTQEDLAHRADLTKGFISMLERDLTSPSLDTLELILNALDTTLGELFEDSGPEKIVYKEDERVLIDEENGIIKEILIPQAQGREVDVMIVTLEAGAAMAKERPHFGDESGLVLSGQIVIGIGKDAFKANTGEAFYYTADKTHWIENRSDKSAKILWISAPPSF